MKSFNVFFRPGISGSEMASRSDQLRLLPELVSWFVVAEASDAVLRFVMVQDLRHILVQQANLRLSFG